MKQKERGTAFEMELASAQLTLLNYITKLLGNVTDAQDVLQETNLVLLKKRIEYEPARPFLAWAHRVAYYEVMAWRTRQRRSRLIFSDEVVAQLADTIAIEERPTDRRLRFLEICKKTLPAKLRELMDLYYGEGNSLAEIARTTGRNVGSLANSLYYGRRLMKKCIEEKMAHAGREEG